MLHYHLPALPNPTIGLVNAHSTPLQLHDASGFYRESFVKCETYTRTFIPEVGQRPSPTRFEYARMSVEIPTPSTTNLTFPLRQYTEVSDGATTEAADVETVDGATSSTFRGAGGAGRPLGRQFTGGSAAHIAPNAAPETATDRDGRRIEALTTHWLALFRAYDAAKPIALGVGL